MLLSTLTRKLRACCQIRCGKCGAISCSTVHTDAADRHSSSSQSAGTCVRQDSSLHLTHDCQQRFVSVEDTQGLHTQQPGHTLPDRKCPVRVILCNYPCPCLYSCTCLCRYRCPCPCLLSLSLPMPVPVSVSPSRPAEATRQAQRTLLRSPSSRHAAKRR